MNIDQKLDRKFERLEREFDKLDRAAKERIKQLHELRESMEVIKANLQREVRERYQY